MLLDERQVLLELSDVINYPFIAGYQSQATRALLKDLPDHLQDFKENLKKFEEHISSLDLEPLQELYTTTFDIQGRCCLDLGFVLWGEDYKRGDFLVKMKGLQEEYGVDLKSELPDHLPNVLKLLAKMDEQTLRSDLVSKILLPSLSKMQKSFKDQENPYKFLLLAIKSFFTPRYQEHPWVMEVAVC